MFFCFTGKDLFIVVAGGSRPPSPRRRACDQTVQGRDRSGRGAPIRPAGRARRTGGGRRGAQHDRSWPAGARTPPHAGIAYANTRKWLSRTHACLLVGFRLPQAAVAANMPRAPC